MQTDAVATTFAALADPTRRAILDRLALGEASVGELAAPFDLSLPAISRHLGVLERAELITRHKAAQWRRCRLRPAGFKVAAAWLQRYQQFWSDSLERLAEHLEEPTELDDLPAEDPDDGDGEIETETR